MKGSLRAFSPYYISDMLRNGFDLNGGAGLADDEEVRYRLRNALQVEGDNHLSLLVVYGLQDGLYDTAAPG